MAKSSAGGGAKSHIQYRSNNNGRFVSEGRADNMKKENVTREHVPNPGHGDTDRGKGK